MGVVVLAGLLGALVVSSYHDRSWYAPDEGIYAHVAERILGGEVLHRDVQDIHAGYVNFVNALCLGLFGVSLRSLRYPLVWMGVVQASIVAALLVRRSPLVALGAAVCISALGAVQFLNPSANWYVLFLTIVLIAWLSSTKRGMRGRVEVVGLLVVTIFLFRQVSGAILAVGAVLYLLHERASVGDRPRSEHALGIAIGTVASAGLAGFLALKSNAVGVLLFGLWALLLAGVSTARCRMSSREAAGLVSRLALGGGIAALPLAAYLVAHGAVTAWWSDAVYAALAQSELEFIGSSTYAGLLRASAGVVSSADDLASVSSGIFWIAMAGASVVAGALASCRILREREHPLPPLAFIAVFYAVVSAPFQIPVYLMFSAGLSCVAVLGAAAEGSRRVRCVAAAAALTLAGVGLELHAAQPLERGFRGIVEGERTSDFAACPSTRCGLSVPRPDEVVYREVFALIEAHSGTDDPIFALPVDPQLYFLTGRPNPFRFYSTSFGIASEAELVRVVDQIRRSGPRLVIHKPSDKYNDASSHRIMEEVRRGYDPLASVGPFELYLRRPEAFDAPPRVPQAGLSE